MRRASIPCRAQYHAEGLDEEVLRAFGIEDAPQPELSRWIDIMDRYANPEGEVTIGVVGKYVGLPDAYKSLHEALVHGGIANRVKVHIRWIDAELFEQPDSDIAARLEPMHGILVPGGFGVRGSEGKIASVRFARERGCPSSASVSGCRWRASRARATRRGLPTLPPPNSAPDRSEPVVGLHHRMDEQGRPAEARRGRRPRRYDAARRLSGEAGGPATAMSRRSTAPRHRSANATATATR
jgi:CTP synthase